MTPVSGSLWRLALFAAAMVGVLVLVIGAIQRPVTGPADGYRAVFTDANGLKTGDDVRMYGVGVGKVQAIELDHDRASVRFSAKTSAALYDNTRLAIRYQNMTGQRYVDIQQPDHPGARLPAGTTIPVGRTVPSFDVTALFNGLKPVLSTLSPQALNKFAESMIAVIEGNGSGIGPALDAIGKLGDYVGGRQQVISVLMRNLSEISDKIGGKSPQLVTLLRNLADVYESLQVNMNGLVDFAQTAPPVLYPLDDLLATLGFPPGDNPDVDDLVRRIFPDPKQAVDVLSRLPAVLTALDDAVANFAGPQPLCSKGKADVPQVLGVLIAGQKVAICKR
ncbi:Mce family protein MceB [Nocardia nova SH22a]|uniref:Mce family protein MceB n=1 Tax=Nocardia nova SH22a TaxID=1415166 RepID=W5TLG6_9NOCA|nr:MlaD family protein [Nocardia nova]AHH19974.1 Mce family protein MceB [Nocardia nova SH22a]